MTVVQLQVLENRKVCVLRHGMDGLLRFDKSIAFVKRLTARSFIHSLLCVVDSHLKIKPSNKKGFVVKSHSHK